MSQDTKKADNVSAVILSCDTDFGRCPLASRLQRSVWPIAESTVLQNLVDHISNQGIDQIVICCQGPSQKIRKILNIPQDINVCFHEEPLPAGSAGSIRDAAQICNGQLLVVFHATMLVPPDIDDMIRTHTSSHADMTVVFNPPDEKGSFLGGNGQVYVCNRSIVQHIPQEGYCDIKEGLIPDLLRQGRIVHAACASDNVGNFLSWRQYLDASANYIAHVAGDRTQNEKDGSDENICLSENATIHPTARVFGPALICKGAVLKKDSVLLGPVIVGQNAVIEENAIISESVLWDNSRVARNACLDGCLIDSRAYVPEDSFIKDDLIVRNFNPIRGSLEAISHAADGVKQKVNASLEVLQRSTEKHLPLRSNRTSSMKNPLIIAASILLFLVFIATYWNPVIVDLWKIWNQSDEYSSGMLVPLIAVWIIYARRKTLRKFPLSPSMWGIILFVFAQGLRFFGLFFMYDSAQRLSMIVTIASLVLLLLGPRLFLKLSTVLAMLMLMLPLPNSAQARLTLPLQKMATSSATFCLETVGYNVLRQGNIISIGDTTIAVAEACNGLRMLTAFIIISALIAMITNRSLWQKAVIIASSIPIAFICNTIRLTLTAIAFTIIDGQQWQTVFHDFGGFAMMPLALALIGLELYLLSNIFVTEKLQNEEIIVRAHSDTAVENQV